MMPPHDELKVYLILWGWHSMTGEKVFGLREKNPELPFTAEDLKDEDTPYVFNGFPATPAWGEVPTAWNDTHKIYRLQVNIEPFKAKVAERGGIMIRFCTLEGLETDAGLREYQTNCRYAFNPGLAGIANLIRFYGEQK